MDDLEHPLRPLVTSWLSKIKLAKDYKEKVFGCVAEECMNFYNGPHNFMWDEKYMHGGRGYISRNADGDNEMIAPSFRYSMNKVAELVQLYGPALYHRNPTRQVNPREYPDLPPEVLVPPLPPMLPPEQQQQAVMQQQMQLQVLDQQKMMELAVKTARANLLSSYLNYTPNELDLKKESRRAIDEALIKGLGCLWTELYKPKGSNINMVGSFYDTVDNLLLDPDVEVVEDCTWIARKCCHPIWEVEDEYGFERDAIRDLVAKDGPTFESMRAAAENSTHTADRDRFRRGKTNDILTYWKIYSKMGMGDRLTGIPDELKNSMDEYGANCFIVVADGVPFPLNLPSDVLLGAPEQDPMAAVDPMAAQQYEAALQAWKDEMFQRVQWPIPFWADGSWPFTPISFHEVPNCVYPMSHVAPGLGELKWLNWAMSFLATKVRTSCKTTIAMVKAAGEDLKQQYLKGGDNAVLLLEQAVGSKIPDVIQFLQQPPFHGDIYNVIAAITDQLEKRLGLTELAYGQSNSSYRSAAEANVKQGQFSIRPEDMANQVEDAMSAVSRKEAIAARWLLTQDDVVPILGQMGAQAWAQLVMSQDLDTIVREFDYRIEAGSVRKPNKAARVEQMQQAIQVWGPFLQQYTFATGDVKPIQALMDDWGKAMDLDVDRYALLPPPPPMPPEQEENQGPPKKEQAA